jgi:hypothetical protein
LSSSPHRSQHASFFKAGKRASFDRELRKTMAAAGSLLAHHPIIDRRVVSGPARFFQLAFGSLIGALSAAINWEAPLITDSSDECTTNTEKGV